MDDLTRIDGIGKATAKKLAAAGIDSFDKLARFGEFPDLADTIEVKADWIEKAREVANAEAAAQQQENTPPEGGPGAGSGDGQPADAEAAGNVESAPDGDAAGSGANATTLNSTDAPQSEDASGTGDPAGPAQPSTDELIAEAAVEAKEQHAAVVAELDGVRTEFGGNYPALSAAVDAWRAAGNDLPPRVVRIAAKRRQGFRRAGMKHGHEPVDHPALQFGPDDLEALLSEPKLKVEFA